MASAQSFFFPAGVNKAISRGFIETHVYFHRHTIFFYWTAIMSQRQATTAAAAAAVHRACYNQLATTLQRYRAQQQQATPCACDTSARYCVELLWKAPEIRHSYLLVLVPNISRLLVAVLCGSRGQPREVSSTYAYHTCLLLLSSSI